MVVDGDLLHLMEVGEVICGFVGAPGSCLNQTKIPMNQLPHNICEKNVSGKI
jgi:hypothetical protein